MRFNDQEIDVKAGATLLELAEAAALRIPHTCRKKGACHECLIQVRRGAEALSPPSERETFLREGYRLACQAVVEDAAAEIHVHAPRRGTLQIAEGGRAVDAHLDPCVTKSEGRVLIDGQDTGPAAGPVYGVAADIGTTTVVLRLVDLESGATRAGQSFENPQGFGGPDVMGRITYDGETGNGELHRVLTAWINHSIEQMTERLGITPDAIYEFVAAGNATMRDLLFRLDVQGIGRRPFQSVTEKEFRDGRRATTSLHAAPAQVGLKINKGGRVYGAPLIACHVGADTAACLAAIAMDRESRIVALMDIGTNTELVLGNRDRILCASCPAGPAFEGGRVACGMPGLEGAIETLAIRDGRVEVSVIGGGRPEGICGSGLIDTMGELLRTGRINMLGRIEGTERFWIDRVAGIYLANSDLSHLAQAKGANMAGVLLLARQYGIGLERIERFYLAGGFARYINVEQAIRIGMIPDIGAERFEKIGNAAIEGATAMLRSRSVRERVERLVRRVEHVELESDPRFFEVFVDSVQFKRFGEN